ncbi:MAG: hypothetical protein KC731_06240 [Myxococcales bacterium]|nr:hypothetical protein [Myxococcales bacterium]
MNTPRLALFLAVALLACDADRWGNLSPGTETDPGTGDGGGGAATMAPPVTGEGGDGGEGGALPSGDAPCVASSAFRATGMSFTEPTPKDLALALNDASYGYDAAPVTVVLRVAEEGTTLAASATELGSDDLYAFLGDAPDFVGASLWDGGFRSDTPQLSGSLRIEGVAIPLENITIEATTSSDCSQGIFVMDAVLPSGAGDLQIAHEISIADLAGAGGSLGWQLRALFTGESIPFAFEN